MTDKPIAIDLYAGLGGWTEGLLAEGYYVVGFDIEQHVYGQHRYPGQLVVQDVLTLHGSQFKDAALIVASPPCQEYSYMAMPWTRAKQIAAALRGKADFPEGYTGSRTVEELNALFNACFRIQREASEAAGHHVPMVVENVRGAQPWVGRARWSYGSFYLWGDVPALMPPVRRYGAQPGNKRTGRTMCFPAGSSNPEAVRGRSGKLHWQDDAIKNNGGSWFNVAHNTTSGVGKNPVHGMKPPARQSESGPAEGRKSVGSGAEWFDQNTSSLPSSSPRCKAASAMIAKIPLPLSRHIGATYFPREQSRAA